LEIRPPHAIIIAGPNGAGKSTVAKDLLQDQLDIRAFVNADVIAGLLAPSNPDVVAIAAGRTMLAQIARLRRARADFAFEATLSGRALPGAVREMVDAGYRVDLFYLWLPTVEMAIRRVRRRVLLGGHSVPEEMIRRRYDRSLRNFGEYRHLVDEWKVFHGGARRVGGRIPLIARGTKDRVEEVRNADAWRIIQRSIAPRP
jgi:predicted ABC-type ATPase